MGPCFSQGRHRGSITPNKKAPDTAGAFESSEERGSVIRDQGSAPVEAIDQRGGDGLHPRLGGDGIGSQSAGWDDELRDVCRAIIGSAVFGLPEQSGEVNS